MNKELKRIYKKYKTLIETAEPKSFIGESLLIDFTQDELDTLVMYFGDDATEQSDNDLAELTAIIIRRDYDGPVKEQVAIDIVNRIVIDLTIAGMVKRGLLSISNIDKFTGEWTVKLTELGLRYNRQGVLN